MPFTFFRDLRMLVFVLLLLPVCESNTKLVRFIDPCIKMFHSNLNVISYNATDLVLKHGGSSLDIRFTSRVEAHHIIPYDPILDINQTNIGFIYYPERLDKGDREYRICKSVYQNIPEEYFSNPLHFENYTYDREFWGFDTFMHCPNNQASIFESNKSIQVTVFEKRVKIKNKFDQKEFWVERSGWIFIQTCKTHNDLLLTFYNQSKYLGLNVTLSKTSITFHFDDMITYTYDVLSKNSFVGLHCKNQVWFQHSLTKNFDPNKFPNVGKKSRVFNVEYTYQCRNDLEIIFSTNKYGLHSEFQVGNVSFTHEEKLFTLIFETKKRIFQFSHYDGLHVSQEMRRTIHGYE